MPELEDLSDVIGCIYDTTLDRSLWPEARASRFVGVLSTSIVTIDARRTGKVLLEDHIIDPHYLDLYFNTFIKIDPFFVPKLFIEPGEVVAASDIMPFEALERTRIYREWAKPQGLHDCLNAALERSVDCVACVAMLMRSPSGDESKRRAKILLPHFRHAVLIAGILDTRGAKASAFGAALDGLSAGIFFVDAEARPKHANAAGHALLERRWHCIRRVAGSQQRIVPPI